jgi:uncharacterized coiled-coil DUF342 family protein
MSSQELEKIKRTLADLTQEAKRTDAQAEEIKRSFEELRERAKQLKERSDRVQRRLAAAG